LEIVSQGMGNKWRMFARALIPSITEGEIQKISSSHSQQDSKKFTREVLFKFFFFFEYNSS